MPLQWNKIEIPFGFGIDETAHRFIQSPPGVAQLFNGRIDKDGQINFRPGYNARAQAPGQPYWLFGYNESLYCAYQETDATTNTVCQALACLNSAGARFDPQGGFVATNALTEAQILERLAVARDTTRNIGDFDDSGTVTGMQGFDFTIDESTDQCILAWIQRTDDAAGSPVVVYATVLDTLTRAVVKPAQKVSNTAIATSSVARVKVIKEGTTVHVVYDDPPAGTIRCRDYDLSTQAWGADTQLVANYATLVPGTWDAAEGGANFWALAYRDTTPQLHTCLMVGAAVSTQTTLAEDPLSIAVLINGAVLPSGIIWVVYHRNATDLRGIAYDLAFGVTAGPTTIEAVATLACTIGIVEVAQGTKLLICWTTLGTATTRTTSKYRTWTTAGVLGTQCDRYSLRLASKPVFYGSVCYANYLYAGLGDTSPVLLTMALTGVAGSSTGAQVMSYRTCAVWMQGFAGYIPQDSTTAIGGSPPTFRLFGNAAEHWFPALIRDTIRNETVVGRMAPRIFGKNGLDLCRVDLNATDVRRPAEIGGNVVIPGGKTQVFDGQGVIDHGMWYPPEDVVGTVAAGGALLAGDYQVALIWKYETEHGVLRSPPVFPTDSVTGDPLFTTALNDKITLSIPCLNVTQMFNAFPGGNQRGNAVQVEIYRTEANGSVLYLEDSLLLSNDVLGTSTHLSVALVATDVSIKDNAELYTTGDILASWPLPACDCFVVYKNRVFGISSEDKKQLVFTQFLQDGEVPQWHPFLELRLDDDGPCTGLAVMDDNLVVFKEDAVYLVRGNGPDRKGLNQDYIVSKVQSPHGCIDRRSIVVDPRGVTFRARMGIMLLNRQLQVQYFGVKIEDFMVDAREILDCAALPNYTERLYFLTDDGGATPRIFVYQWNNDQWAVDTIENSEQGSAVPLCIAWVDGIAYVAFANELTVYAHELDMDPHATFGLVIVSNWFAFSGPQGFKRIRAIEFLGEYQDTHEISVFLFRDYEEVTAFQSVTFDKTETALWQPYQFKIHVSEQRCEALRYAIFVTPQVVGDHDIHSDSVTLVAQAFDVGIKPTLKRLPDAQMRG
jgi:hypothetical protein